MTDVVPTVKKLADSPQLAVLSVLERTLRVASSALLATYDDPEDASALEDDSIEAAYAYALVNQLTALELTLSRYRRRVGLF